MQVPPLPLISFPSVTCLREFARAKCLMLAIILAIRFPLELISSEPQSAQSEPKRMTFAVTENPPRPGYSGRLIGSLPNGHTPQQ